MIAFTFFFYFLNMVIKKFKIMNVADICSSVVCVCVFFRYLKYNFILILNKKEWE